jgi:hypothetical protein
VAVFDSMMTSISCHAAMILEAATAGYAAAVQQK